MTSYMQRKFYNLLKPKIFLDNSLLVTSVHSGTFYPDFFIRNLLSDKNLCSSMEDMFVNDLLQGIEENGVNFLKSNISRSVIDLNRKDTEIDLALIDGVFPYETEYSQLVRSGIGLLPYRTTKGDVIFKRRFKIGEVLFLINNFYKPWHSNLKKISNDIWNQMGRVTILDMHSMPDAKGLPDIVLGNRFGKTCNLDIMNYFSYNIERLGYSVEINKPYAGGFITKEYCNEDKNIQTLQLEINRKLYMDEENFTKNHNFQKLKLDIKMLITDFSHFLKSFDYKKIINE